MGTLRLRLPCLFALALWLWSFSLAHCAPREDLLELVPDDISLCLVVNKLREHNQKLMAAPWVAKLANSALGKTLQQMPEFQQLQKIDKDLQDLTKVSWAQLRDDILGDCLVLAFHQSPNQDGKEERGLGLLWARDPKLLAQLIQLVNQEQKKSGELKEVLEKKYQGVTYFQRKEADKNQFYLQQGSLFVFTTQEPMLHQVIDRQRKKDATKTSSAIVKSFAKLSADNAVATLWVNPRSFDKQWQQEKNDKDPAKLAFLQYWKALDALAVCAFAGNDLELSLTLQGRPVELPKPAQGFFQTASVPSDLWQRFPPKAILTTACRIDAEAGMKMLDGFLSGPNRDKFHETLQKNLGAALGRDFVQEVLNCIGPDLGVCIAANPEARGFPHAIIALRIQSGPKDAKIDQAIFRTAQFFAGLAVFDYNRKQKSFQDHIKIKTQDQDKIEVKYLTHRDFPTGFQPAIALKEGYFLVASSPEAIKQFSNYPTKVEGVPLLHLSIPQLSTLLQGHRQLLVENFAKKNQLPEQVASNRFDEVLSVLGLADHLHLRQQTSPGQVAFHLRLKMSN